MNAPDAPLLRLTDRLGLLRRYVSAAGETVEVPPESLRALAAALGYAAESDEAAERSLAALDKAAGGALDRVLVVREGALVEAAWRGAADAPLDWRVVLEDGSSACGQATPEPAGGAGAPTLRLPVAALPLGYHRLEVRAAEATHDATLIVVPRRAYTPEEWERDGRRDWAVTAQLYSLRSARNWGVGDFSDLGVLAAGAARLGASAVGLNPLHALFPANPGHISPYSPSSRAFLNPVYIDVEAVPEYADCDAARRVVAGADFQARLQAARDAELVDYPAVWSLKCQVLRALHRALRERNPACERARDFAAYRRDAGAALERFAVFEALQEHLVAQGCPLSWRDWPEAYRDAGSPAVAAFAAEHAEAVEFSQFLQWETDRQLGMQAQAMRAAGMATGLYRDVAVGVDPHGAEAWGDPTLLVAGAAVGAPPDLYNPNGQNWGLTPFNPVALKQLAYAPFVAALRANMRHAGAIRIDHVIGLQRLYWVPAGAEADAGGYIAYPYDELMGLVALESRRHRCFVVGEDLGTVPEGFRNDAAQRGVLSYRVLMFEREHGDGAFLPPHAYPELAAAAVSTHDLPTLAGFWSARDQQWRRDLGLYPTPQDAERDADFRRSTRHALVAALAAHGGLAPDAAAVLARDDPPPQAIAALVEAAHRFLAAAPSRLLLVQLEDLAGEVEQMNLPGTVDEHPNWRRKLRRPLDRVLGDAAVLRVAQAVAAARGTLPEQGSPR